MRTRLFLPLIALLGVVAVEVPTTSAAPPRPTATVRDTSFTDVLVTAGVSAPVAVAALPDGRAVVLEQAGRVRIIQGGTLVAAPALTLTVCSNSERGLLGFEPDPHFGVNGLVYVYYTRPNPAAPGGCVNRVSRFRMAGNTIARNSEVVLLDNIGSPRGNHNGGDVAIGSDGFLYVSVGDGGCSPRDPVSVNTRCAGANTAAQDLSLLNGKILRVNRVTGAPAAGNPFTGTGTAVCRTRGNAPSTPTTRCREIFAWGLRNPWRFAFDPNTGATRFFINDVGQNTREEVDLGLRGANYGWPMREGWCAQGVNRPCAGPPTGLTQPLTDYSHATTGSYVTGGAFVPNGAWAKAYDGGYLFADGNPGKIFFRNAAGVVNYAAPFATGVGGISDMSFVMDAAGWSLYYVLPGSNEVHKIVPTLPAAPASGALAYIPATPKRWYDTNALGVHSGAMWAGTSRLVRVVASRGVHRAALVNITVVKPQSTTTVTAWYPRTVKPSVPVAVVDRLTTTATTAVVPIDGDGLIMLHTTGTARVIVDVLGYFDVAPGGQSTAGRFVPTAPTRAVTTLQPANGSTNVYTRSGTLADTIVNVPIGSSFGVTSGASAVVLAVQAVGSPGATGGHVVVYPHGAAAPPTSNLNLDGPSDRRLNLVVVPLGADGSVDLRLRNISNVIVDVIGSFTGAGAGSSSTGTFVVAVPTTVSGVGPFAAPGSVVSNPPSVPDTAIAVAQTLTMVQPSGAGTLTALADVPSTPTGVNVVASASGQTRVALAFTGLAGGAERIDAGVATNVRVAIFGWFVA